MDFFDRFVNNEFKDELETRDIIDPAEDVFDNIVTPAERKYSSYKERPSSHSDFNDEDNILSRYKL